MGFKSLLKTARRIEDWLRAGYSQEQIVDNLGKEYDSEAYEIAKARIIGKKTKHLPDNFIYQKNDLRFATNPLVAEYRARRLKCKTLVDVGCGIGIQTLAFAKKCDKVYAIEKDKRKIEYAKFNIKQAGSHNVIFIHGLAEEELSKIKDANIVFCDPERAPSEKSRNIENISPKLGFLLSTSQKIKANLSLELPPQLKEPPEDCELEYISINNSLNRLTTYFGKLAKCRTSVVALPEEAMLNWDGKIIECSGFSKTPRKFIYDPDKAILKANMLDILLRSLENTPNAKKLDFGKVLITCDAQINNTFLTGFKLIKSCIFTDLKEELEKMNYGKAVLHASFPPDEYWKIRNNLESELKGDKCAHIFIDKPKCLITEKLG